MLAGSVEQRKCNSVMHRMLSPTQKQQETVALMPSLSKLTLAACSLIHPHQPGALWYSGHLALAASSKTRQGSVGRDRRVEARKGERTNCSFKSGKSDEGALVHRCCNPEIRGSHISLPYRILQVHLGVLTGPRQHKLTKKPPLCFSRSRPSS